MKKALTCVPALLLVLAVLAGCTPAVTDAPTSLPTEAPSAEPTEAPKSANTRTLVSKASGKVLTSKAGVPALKSYNFAVADEFEVITDNNLVTLANAGDNVALVEDGGTAWEISPDEVGWTTLKNMATGHYLIGNADGTVMLTDTLTGTKADYWYFNMPYSKSTPHSDMSWMEGKFGIFHHLLPDATVRRNLANRLNTEALVNQLVELKADFYVLTVGQMSGYWNTENKMFASLVSYQPTKRATTEDIISRTAKAVKDKGMKFIAYCVPMAPITGVNDWEEFGFTYNSTSGQYIMNTDACMLWSLVLQEWSRTYGDLVDGWWIDGCYPWVNFCSTFAWMYASALKAGNPNAGVAFNENVTDATGQAVRPWMEAEDFSCGETNYPMGDHTKPVAINTRNNWIYPRNGEAPKTSSGSQYFLLTYLGTWWLNNDIRYTPALWAEYAGLVANNGGCLALDTALDVANGYIITEEAMNVLRTIRDAIKK